jgi:hypothetical protein
MKTVTIRSTKKKPNKLILLGNGFDLAHGLKTSYSDFIDWYLNNVKEAFDKDDYFDDNLIELRNLNSFMNIDDHMSPYGQFYDSNNIFEKRLQLEVVPTVKNQFWNEILSKSGIIKWVDIEQLYYDEFKSLAKKAYALKESEGDSDIDYFEDIKTLNSNLEEISELLKKYLKENIPSVKEGLKNGFEFFFEEMSESDLIVNFNYTNTVDDYFNFGNRTRFLSKITRIHGNVNDKEAPLVFGFGDERDSYYQDIENINDNSLMNHFKSFAYFKNQNYSKLLSFIDSEPFEIHTIGLSCGLSDRTLLSQIFEHENCEKIHIQYYKDENGYQDVARNISRHFSDKQELRRKLVNYKECKPCP